MSLTANSNPLQLESVDSELKYLCLTIGNSEDIFIEDIGRKYQKYKLFHKDSPKKLSIAKWIANSLNRIIDDQRQVDKNLKASKHTPNSAIAFMNTLNIPDLNLISEKYTVIGTGVGAELMLSSITYLPVIYMGKDANIVMLDKSGNRTLAVLHVHDKDYIPNIKVKISELKMTDVVRMALKHYREVLDEAFPDKEVVEDTHSEKIRRNIANLLIPHDQIYNYWGKMERVRKSIK